MLDFESLVHTGCQRAKTEVQEECQASQMGQKRSNNAQTTLFMGKMYITLLSGKKAVFIQDLVYF